VEYAESKVYPFLPRYFMLKEMIRDVLNDPAFLEVSHENHSLLLPQVSATITGAIVGCAGGSSR
jgi:hypothetical protein